MLYAYQIQDGDAFLQLRANVCSYACDEKTTFPSQNLCMTTLVLMCVTRPQKIDVVDDSLFVKGISKCHKPLLSRHDIDGPIKRLTATYKLAF